MDWRNAAEPGPEQAQLLAWSTGPERHFEVDACIHGAFTNQAALTPSALAAVFGNEAMTYAELDDRSGRLAAYLRQRGVTSGVTVGVCAQRSLEMWVGVLAIFNAALSAYRST
jgi:non-ribosomal peptide synthetase component F